MLKLCMLCLLGVVCAVILKNVKPEFSLLIKFTVLLLLLLFLMQGAREAVDALLSLTQSVQIDSSMLSVLLKALGICIASQITANICKDCGEGALSTGVEMAGRISILILCIPIAAELMQIGLGWFTP